VKLVKRGKERSTSKRGEGKQGKVERMGQGGVEQGKVESIVKELSSGVVEG